MSREQAAGWAAAVVVLSGALASFAPAIADDAFREAPKPRTDREPSVRPELEPYLPKVPVTLDYLIDYERSMDPAGTSAAYVCANEGDESLTVVFGKQAPPNAVADLNPGPGPEESGDYEPLDPCEGKTLTVGREQRN
ncbi:hypothetical protein ACLM5J_17190 [Nocardioides sp. Bht2]|uniref:hypothetical protein n=1 Tax=Nocardioides sp. Bht2 TaxID=3392297 RepID=UPI0039B5668E